MYLTTIVKKKKKCSKATDLTQQQQKVEGTVIPTLALSPQGLALAGYSNDFRDRQILGVLDAQ